MKSFRKLIISLITVIALILVVNPIGASAEWKQDSKGWWNKEGKSYSIGWKQIDSKWYYFNQDGYMVHDTIINGYKIGSDGAWVQNTSIQTIETTLNPKWESGGINLKSGVNADYKYCIRTKLFKVDKETILKIAGITKGKAICVFTYDYNGNMLSNIGYTDKPYILKSGINYRIVFGFSDGKIDASNVEETKQNILLLQPKYGQYGSSMNILGDSFTDATFQTQYTKYYEQIKNILGIKTINNYGQGGTCVTKGDVNNNSFIDRYNTMNKDADIVLVFGGTNDWGKHKKLGTINDTVNTTFYGAMNELCDNLNKNYSNKKIIFVTPIMRISPADGCVESLPANEQVNNLGLKLVDYVDAMIKVCKAKNIPVCDLYRTSGLNPINRQSNLYTTYYADGIHPNNKGYEIIGEEISEFIENQSK